MTILGPQFRQATENDFEELCELFEELDSLHRSARPDMFRKPVGPVREAAYVSTLIAGPDSTILVASEDSRGHPRLCGFATLLIRHVPASIVGIERRYLEIDNLAVRKEDRRRGIGRSLIECAVRWAHEKAVRIVELGVHEFNSEGLSFYEALGFSTTRRRMELDIAQRICWSIDLV